MKHFGKILLLLLLLSSLGISAMAVSEATSVQSNAAIGQDGSCTLSVTVQIHLDTAATNLYYPLPAQAEDVALNGGFVTTYESGGKLLVELPNLSAGDYTFTLTYRLPAVVSRENEQATVTLPLLSGFGYPIRSLTFSVTLPGSFPGQPTFSSGYHQEDISQYISIELSGNSLSAAVHQSLKDHETLVMTLTADASMFPLVSGDEPLIDFWDGAVLVCIVLAVIYYLLTLMPQITHRARCFTAPDGINAGEVGLCLTGTGVDLTLMVLTWAQLGYLQLELRDKRKVLLYKRMEMGNERREFEVRAFQALFGNRRMVDGTGVHYARLYRKMAAKTPLMRQLFKPASGHPLIFRLLSCAAGCISGVKLGLAMTEHPVLRALLAALCCLLCGALSYFIQAGGKCLPLRSKAPMALALGCGGVWIALGYVAGTVGLVVPMVIFQLACGIAIAYGGRRSELGKRSLAQIRGLRRYMVRANTFELQQRLQANLNYYYELAPYALALGVDKRFARRFGKTELAECGFLSSNGPRPVTASQWAAQLRQITDILNARQKRLPYERLTGR